MDWVHLLKVVGFSSTEHAINVLGMGEHIWVRDIGDVLIYVHKLGETNYRIGVYQVERMASRFSVKRLSVDAKVGYGEVNRMRARLVDRLEGLCGSSVVELIYQDFVNVVKGLGFQVQVNP